MSNIDENKNNMFRFLPNKKLLETEYRKYVSKTKKENGTKEEKERVEILSYDDFWRGSVLESFKVIYDEDGMINFHCFGDSVNLEIIYFVRDLGFLLSKYIKFFEFDEYLKLREYLSNGVKNYNISYIETSILNGIFYIATKPSFVFDTLKKLSEEVNSDGGKAIEWYPFNKLEWKDIEVFDEVTSYKVNKRVCERTFEEISTMDCLKVIFEINGLIIGLVTEYSKCFCLDKENLNYFYFDKKCESYSEAKEFIEREGIDDLFKLLDEKFGFLESESYSWLFGGILSKMRELREWDCRERSELEILLLKTLKNGFNSLGAKRADPKELRNYVSDIVLNTVSSKACGKKRFRKKSGDVFRRLHHKGE